MKIGIRIEDKYASERRAAITPEHAKRLIEKHNLEIQFLPCKKRIFTDEEYIAAGCKPAENLNEPNVIFGVKEIPIDFFEPEKTYIFFSHTIKGQPYNMKMLKKMQELRCNLIDYERVVDENGKRLIFFGKYAGLAGMINSLWSLGLRLKAKGIETPFLQLKQAHQYTSLEEAKAAVKKVGDELRDYPLPAEISPLIIGFTGYGNVSNGAQEIANLLPIKEITPDELLTVRDGNHHGIYKVIFKEVNMYERKDGTAFDLQHFFKNPGEYFSVFDKFIPHLTVLMNCMFWTKECDRIVTKQWLKANWRRPDCHLLVIGDITCDPDGSIECTHEGTPIEDPIFVYNPDTETPTFGYSGDGILVMAVDILPSELPRESSHVFADALEPFIFDIVTCNYDKPFSELTLPAPIHKALILHKGTLTPDYQYLTEFVERYS